MKQITALLKKETMECVRTGKFTIVMILFFLFGVMSPALAKLTPWIFEMMSETMSEQGLIVKEVEVTVFTSWVQYYKDYFTEPLVFIILFFGILTNEYQKGTLVPILTKGISRQKVILTKGLFLFLAWTVSYYFCFFVTYGYNEFFWGNASASHVMLAGFYSYLFGLWLLSLVIFWSGILNTGTSVLLCTGAVYIVTYLLGMIPTLTDMLPTKLTAGMALLNGTAEPKDYLISLLVTILLILAAFIGSVFAFKKKRL